MYKLTMSMNKQLLNMFKINDRVKTDLNVEGIVVNYVEIQGKIYIKIRWKNGTFGVYGPEEIKRYNIKKVA